MRFYIDMDDVVADWMGYAREMFRRPEWKEGEMLPDHVWNRLKDDQRMYSKLPLKEGAIKLIHWMRRYQESHPGTELYFLTAIPHNNDMPYSFTDKVFWADRYFPNIPVFFGPYSHDKWVRCTGPDDILIDDRTSNCQEWERASGRAHIYREWAKCQEWLEEHIGKP